MSRAAGTRAAGLALGFAADRLLGDPRRLHPVAGFGRVAGVLEQRTWQDSRPAGAVHVGVLVGGAIALGALTEQVRRPLPRTLLVGAATWAVLGGRSLDREVAALESLLLTGDLDGARRRLRNLVGRDTSRLTEPEIVRAALESLAENTSDAVVSSLVWGAVAGVPGLLAHRAANTLDAMVGHRSTRYARFGWAGARLDDVLNLPGSRLSAALTCLVGPDRSGALRAWRRDAAAHPSPNAGPVEAAFAGALGVRLGGRNVYGPPGDQWVEDRAVMGDGRTPEVADLSRARRLALAVDLGALAVAGLSAAARG
ncbi:cobalamin biosynthesis protein [Nocardioides sambongensis]|uniref:cobalamin biosynthesis protein n=1 Tax=Nocardioides sambongensis TaxID=2589074 RepID=UPI001127D9D2|nr:cobalamin biosynthesis protein [Nocardioides sambongensis]